MSGGLQNSISFFSLKRRRERHAFLLMVGRTNQLCPSTDWLLLCFDQRRFYIGDYVLYYGRFLCFHPSICCPQQATSRSFFFFVLRLFKRSSVSITSIEELNGAWTDGRRCLVVDVWKKAIFLQHKWKLGISSFLLAIQRYILLLQPLSVNICSNWHCDDLKSVPFFYYY